MLTKESTETSEAKASWIWTDFAPPRDPARPVRAAEPMNVHGIVEGLGALLNAMYAAPSEAWE